MTPDNRPDEEPVATGDRRDDVQFEPDPDQLVRMRATFKPEGPLPPEEHSAASERGEDSRSRPPVQDVRVAAPGPSVWDARPGDPSAGSEPSGTPKAH